MQGKQRLSGYFNLCLNIFLVGDAVPRIQAFLKIGFAKTHFGTN